MKKFRFRLERIREYRETLKKESERELLHRNYQLREAEEGVESIKSAQERAKSAEDEDVTMAEFALSSAYKERLQEALVQQRLLVLEAADAVDRAREVYLERAVDAEVLEKLKKRRRAEHTDKARKEERKERNQLTVHRFGRGYNSGGES